MPYQLKPQIVKKIQQGGAIYGLIADELNIAPVSLPVILNRNHRRLTEIGNLIIISEHFNIPVHKLYEKRPVKKPSPATQ